MSKEVNLIANKRKSRISQERLVKDFQRIAYVSVIITALCTLGMYFINKDQQLPQLQKQDSILTQNLSLSKQKILKLMLVKSRLADINTLLNKRSNFDQTIASLINALPAGVVVNTFSLNTKTIDISVSSNSLIGINQFLDFAISKLNNKELFQKLTVNGLIANEKTQTYQLLLEAQPL